MFWCSTAGPVYLTKSRNIPKLGRKVSAFFDLSFIESNVLSGRGDAHQTKSQAVGAVLVDQLERIRRIAKRLRHFATLAVANDAGKENVVERNVVLGLVGRAGFELNAGNDHSRDPEKNDIGPGHQNTCGIKLLPRLPIHGLISPQPR